MSARRIKKLFSSSRKRGGYEIHPDEIFLDSHNLPDFDVNQFEGRIEKPISRSTFQVLSAFIVLVGIIFIGQLWILQINRGEAFEIRSLNNVLQHTTKFSERGIIFDRNMVELAWNEYDPSKDFALRKYSEKSGFSHLVGYVKYPLKDKSGVYYKEAFTGKDGVESYYDKELTGENGVKLTETNAMGEVQSESVLTPPKDGSDLNLSIDSKIQSKLYEIIKQAAVDRGFSGGAGVIMDVHNGELLAMTSYPEYNQNILTDGTDASAITATFNEKGNPFLNRVISGLYIPGSIMKTFIAMGVLNERIIDPKKEILSTGSIKIPNPYNPDKPTIFRDWKVHGWVDMRQAISHSSDEYFYTVGGGNGSQKGIGIDNIEKYVKMFGFGTLTGIKLFGEQAGNVPSREWKTATFDDSVWRLGDTYNSSIGQYGYQVTPIQAVRGVATFANGGTLLTPTVILGDKGNDSKLQPLPFSYSDFQIVRDGMRMSATEGAAKSINIPGVTVAVKTGTAELGVTKNFVNSWVTGFFPYENPRFAFAIMMERGPVSNTVGATSVMRTLLEWMSVYSPEYVK